MADLLIACHSAMIHGIPSYRFGTDGEIKTLTENQYTNAGLATVDYIDVMRLAKGEEGRYIKWDAIPASSKDIIWSLSCPVYPLILKRNTMSDEYKKRFFDSFISQAGRVLRKGGKFYIAASSDTLNVETWNQGLEYLRENCEKYMPGFWKVSLVELGPEDLVIAKEKSMRHLKRAFVLEKIIEKQEGGRSRKRKRSRKTRKLRRS